MKTLAVNLMLICCGFSSVFSVPLETSKKVEHQRRSAVGHIDNYYTNSVTTYGGGLERRPGHGAIGSIDNYVVGADIPRPLSSNDADSGSSFGSGSSPGLVNYYSSSDHENPVATFVPHKYMYAGWKFIPNGFWDSDDETEARWRNKVEHWNSKIGASSPGIVNYYD